MQDVEIIMPDLSTTGDSVRLTKWLVEPGKAVKLGQPLCEVETDKAVMEVESVASGVVKTLFIKENDNVNIGQAIAIIQSHKSPG